MNCPECKSPRTRVTGSVIGLVTERYYKCRECGRSFQTTEAVYVDREMVEYMRFLVESGELDKTIPTGRRAPA